MSVEDGHSEGPEEAGSENPDLVGGIIDGPIADREAAAPPLDSGRDGVMASREPAPTVFDAGQEARNAEDRSRVEAEAYGQHGISGLTELAREQNQMHEGYSDRDAQARGQVAAAREKIAKFFGRMKA